MGRGRRIIGMALVAVAILGAARTTDVNGDEIAWRHDYNEALQEAQKTKRPLLVKVSATWCSYCTKMQRETLSQETVVSEVEENFVPLALDADRDRDLVQKFRVSSYPTTIVVAPDRTILRRMPGFQSQGQFMSSLRGALQKLR